MRSNLPSQYRGDPWVVALTDAMEAQLTRQSTETAEIPTQMSLDTVTWNLPVEERLAAISPSAGASLDSRRSALKAKWRSSGTVGIEQIQAVADAWKNGAAAVGFSGGAVTVTFIGEFGVPSDLDGLKGAVSMVIPAHLAVEYFFRYLLISDVQAMTLAQIEAAPLSNFAGGE